LGTVEDGWGRLETVWDGWGRLKTVGDGWGRLETGRRRDGYGGVTVGGRDGDGDDHSNWAWVDKIRATDEDNVEKVLDRLFSMFCAPEVYKTDNGSPFQSHRFKAYHSHEWPRANGKAESFMKKLGKVLKTSKISGQDEQEALREFLRRYNDTPHSTTGVSPNQLLFGFSRSSGIPSVVPETPEQREKFRQEALANDARAKKSINK
jgi:hypothetical protein